MFSAVIVLIALTSVTHVWVQKLEKQFSFLSPGFLIRLYYYHLFLSLVYYLYTLFNPSDSRNYYRKIIGGYRGESWSDFYGTSTTFIEFVGYPFAKFFGFGYEALMVLFAFFGFVGFAHLYIFFKENIRFHHTLAGFDLITIIFFLPNSHFWSGSLGKGSLIFMGVGIFFFGLSRPLQRWFLLLIGGLIIYHVRPHVMLVTLASCFLGFVFASKGIGIVARLSLAGIAAVAFFFIYKDVFSIVGIDESELFVEGLDLSQRARELSKATSGVDLTSYSLGMKLFTFIYRPLFFDAPGILGLIVSFENLFYLVFTFKIISVSGLRSLIEGSAILKSALFTFVTVSIALAQVSANLGLAMRQKSQVMILFLFVVLAFLDAEKQKQWAAYQVRKKREWARKKQLEI